MYWLIHKRIHLAISNFKFQISNFQGGFTLIEMMVSLAILAVVSAASFAAFQSFQQNQLLTGGAQEVFTELRTARTRSISVVNPDACITAGKSLTNYAVSILSATTYQTIITCSTPPTVTSSIKTLQQTLVFSQSSYPQTITFLPLSGSATFSPVAASTVIICRGSCATAQKTIIIQTNGTMTIQ